jgi:membrane fusion protein, multidrug efflux system
MHDRFRLISSAGVIAAILTVLVMTASCKKKEQAMVKPVVPVTVGVVTQKAVPMQIAVIGNVEPSSTIAVKAQVGGTLTKIHFIEGQDVKKGDLLFTIDTRPYEAALKQAEANLARSIAQFDNARAEEKRYEELVKKGYVSQTQYEQVRTNAAALEATVFADKALLENAKLNLGYCTIRAPFSGRTGSLMVYEGNLIKANADTPMVTINQIQPVNVSFAVPEKNLPEIKHYMAGGALKVEAFISKEDKNPAEGRLAFIENIVDTATGTIKLKGAFDNRDRRLWPGQFVHVVLTLAVQNNAVVVPTQAVQMGQAGQFVFAVKDDLTAEVRPVVVSGTFGEESVIESGLKPGEQVVTDGQVRLMPGAKMEIKKESQEQKTNSQKESPKAESPAKDKAK